MYLFYVDESGDPGLNGSRYLLLGGAALFEGQWARSKDLLDEVRVTCTPTAKPVPRELHFKDIRQGLDEYRGWSEAQRGAIIASACNVARGFLPSELRFFVAFADKAEWLGANPGLTGDDLYAVLFEELCSRFDLFLRRRYASGAPSKGMVIVDPHKEALSKALRANHAAQRVQGNRWSRVYNLIETLFFLDSHESPGLQLADLCAYGVWRLVNSADPTMVLQIRDVFDREPLGSEYNAGKWHGVKYLGRRPDMQSLIQQVWA